MYPTLLATDKHYQITDSTSPESFTICSYRSGQVEVICKNTGKISLHSVDRFVKIAVDELEDKLKED